MSLDTFLRNCADRCSGCGFHPAQGCACEGQSLKFAGIARADAAADPDVRAMVDEEIRRAAASGQVFSSNSIRGFLPDDVGPLMGARFLAAAKAGLIVRVGYESSTKASTHAHPIAQWRAAS